MPLHEVSRLTSLPFDAGHSTIHVENLAGVGYEVKNVDNRDADADRVLVPVLVAFDELIEQTRLTLTGGQMNVFDQHRVNSFQRGKSYRRSFCTKLLDGTYRWSEARTGQSSS